MEQKYTCQYCLSEFNKKRVLDKHVQTAKYCLEKRGFKFSFDCTCGKIFLTENLALTHKSKCKIYNQGVLLGKLTEKLDDTESRLEESLKKNTRYIDRIKELETELRVINEDREKYYATVEKAALKDTSKTNNQYNNLLTFPLLDKTRMREKCELITARIVKNGQKALADFFVDKIGTNDNGDVGVICTDKTRKSFKYMRADGKIETDIEGDKLIKSFKDSSSIPIQKSLDQIKREYETNDLYETEEEQLEAYYKIAEEARSFGGPFLAQLVKKTYRKEEDGKLVKVDPINYVEEYKDPISNSQYDEWLERMN